MKSAIVADVHLSDRTTETIRNIFRKTMLDLAYQPVDYLIFLGDFFDAPRCSPSLFKFVIDALAPIQESSIPIIMILGDHEMSNPNQATPLVYCSKMQGYQTIEKTTGLKLSGVSCFFLPPFVENLDCLRGDDKIDAVFFHGFLQNVQVNKHYKMYRSTDFSLENFMESQAKNYFFGGIHTRQSFKTTDNINFAGYPGAFVQRTFGDEDNSAGYLLWDSDQGVESIDIIAPQYKTIRYDGELFKVLEQFTELELPEGQWHVRLILDRHLSNTDQTMIRKLSDHKGFLSLHFETVTKKMVERNGTASISVEHSSIDILDEWLKEKELGDAKRKIIIQRAEKLKKDVLK